MSKKLHIVGIVGSLRKGSYNHGLMKAFQAAAPEGVTIEILDIGKLPVYNQDLDASYPAEAVTIKEKIASADGILIVTPEHNRSVPAVLKNVIDWASRPYGTNSWRHKPVMVAGATVGNLGTALAQYHLKQILLYLDMKVMGYPEFYVHDAGSKFDEQGNLTDTSTKEHIAKALEALVSYIG
jgi:chromate reductase, NAD(P)H dehydrogenase (quinone)